MSASPVLAQDNYNYPIPTPADTIGDNTGGNGKKSWSSSNSNTNSNASSRSMFQGFELGLQWPSVLGMMGQNFNQQLGFHTAAEFNFIDGFRNGLYIGYQNFPILADTSSGFRVIPVLLQMGAVGSTSYDWLKPTFDVGLGGALGWLSTANSTSTHINWYFAFQLQPGLLFQLSDMISLAYHLPVMYLVSKKSMGYLAHDLSIKFNL